MEMQIVSVQQFLRDLADRIDQVKLFKTTPAPEVEVQSGEKVVGVLSDDLRKFFAIYNKIKADLLSQCEASHASIAELAIKKLMHGKLTPEDHDFLNQHSGLHRNAEIIGELFWHGVRMAFPEATNAEVVSLRKGWKVTTSRSRQSGGEFIDLGAIAVPAGLAELFSGLRGRPSHG